MSNYNAREKLQQNIEALRYVLEWDGEVMPSEWEEAKTIQKYSGFGGLKGILLKEEDWVGASEADKKLKPLYDELYDLLESNLTAKEYKKVIDSLRNSVLSSFYTNPVVPDTLFKVLSRYMRIESLYEPSAGSGVFIRSAIENLPNLRKVTAYEKDILTGKILSVLCRHANIIALSHTLPFEESHPHENGQYDVICSNIPFGAIPVYDPTISDRNITGKIHNYFFAKGIEKIKDGGVLAYLTTDGFLNSPANKSARRYLFERCDLLSVIVMPDNLYKESAGTEAPSHLVVVRKNVGKTALSEEEELLCESEMRDIDGVKVAMNQWIYNTEYGGKPTCMIADVVKVGKNQYGKPALEVKWNKSIKDIAGPLGELLTRDLDTRWVKDTDQLERELAEKDLQDELFSRAAEKAIKDSGLDHLFKTKDEWVKEHIIIGGIPISDELSAKEELDDAQRDYEQRWPIRLSDIPDKVKMFLPKHQQQVIVGSEEHWDILENLQNIIEQMPGPYGQDGVPADDKIVYLHYFIGGCDWYITERDEWGIQYQMFGYANLGDDDMAEWGYVGVPELEDSRVELDLFWKPRRFGDIGKEDRMNEVFLNEDTAPSTITAEQAQRMLQQQINVLVNDEENRIWSADRAGSGIAEKIVQRITLPDTCSVEPVKGTIIQVEGKLLQIEKVNDDGTVTVVEPDIKAGRESEIMSAYIDIRNTFLTMEKE